MQPYSIGNRDQIDPGFFLPVEAEVILTNR